MTPGTPRIDTCVYLDEAPPIRLHGSTAPGDRVVLAIDPVLTIFAPADVLRATLVAALAQLDTIEQTSSGEQR